MHSTIFSELIVYRILTASRVRFSIENGATGEKKCRPYHAMYLKIKGSSTYRSAGNVYRSDPNHLVFLPKASNYTVSFDEPGECFLVEFDAQIVATDILSIPLNDPTPLLNSFARLERLWLLKKPSYLPKAMSALYGLFAMLDELTSPAYVPSTCYRFVEAGAKYLEKHYADPDLSIGQLAEAAGVSQVYFRRLFKEIYSVSPIQYIRMFRIEKAKAMLCGEYASIEAVAYAVGFSNPYHFSKTFRQITGQQPSAYARLYR